MVSHLLFSIVFLASLLHSGEWKYEFEKEGIKVFTKEVEGTSLKAFRGEMDLDATIDEIKTVLMDIDRLPEWSYRTSATKIIKQEGNKVYFRSEILTPRIINNREAYFCNHMVQNEGTKEVIITVRTYESEEAVPDGFVRIAFSEGRWILTPIDERNTKIVFQMHADPGGNIPLWFANIVALESPKVTLDNLRNLIRNK